MGLLTTLFMSHIITYTEEIEEHGYCQQRPELRTGDKYLYEVDGEKRLRIVLSVHLDKYVWENVAQWSTEIEEYMEDEYVLCRMPVHVGTQEEAEISVFVAKGLVGVLTRDKDLVRGEMVIPSRIVDIVVKGVCPFGFYDCANLTRVVFSPMVVIAYEKAFAQSGLKEMAFNEEVAVTIHITAVDDCKDMPKFDRLFDFPFPGMYMFCGGKAFRKWEQKLHDLHFLN